MLERAESTMPSMQDVRRLMKLTIVAATGGIGRHLLEQAVAAGHDVTAVVRNPNRLSGEAVRIVTADLAAANPVAIEPAVAGADAVVSGLGPRRRPRRARQGRWGLPVGQPRRCEGYFMSPGAVHRISYGAAAGKGRQSCAR
jgi:uncharacterized protein YbjT (DUF2867 family)